MLDRYGLVPEFADQGLRSADHLLGEVNTADASLRSNISSCNKQVKPGTAADIEHPASAL